MIDRRFYDEFISPSVWRRYFSLRSYLYSPSFHSLIYLMCTLVCMSMFSHSNSPHGNHRSLPDSFLKSSRFFGFGIGVLISERRKNFSTCSERISRVRCLIGFLPCTFRNQDPMVEAKWNSSFSCLQCDAVMWIMTCFLSAVKEAVLGITQACLGCLWDAHNPQLLCSGCFTFLFPAQSENALSC